MTICQTKTGEGNWSELHEAFEKTSRTDLANVARGIIVPWELFWWRSRHAKRAANPRGLFA